MYTEFTQQHPSQLVGRILRGAVIGGVGQDDLSFTTDVDATHGLIIKWGVGSDCCSESRFTDLKLDAVMNKRIVSVAEVQSMVDPALDPKTLRQFDYPTTDWSDGEGKQRPLKPGHEEAPQESEQIYGQRLVAEDGSVGFVIYRNWSNGYYGGWLIEEGWSDD